MISVLRCLLLLVPTGFLIAGCAGGDPAALSLTKVSHSDFQFVNASEAPIAIRRISLNKGACELFPNTNATWSTSEAAKKDRLDRARFLTYAAGEGSQVPGCRMVNVRFVEMSTDRGDLAYSFTE
jgi:hypothetical protein